MAYQLIGGNTGKTLILTHCILVGFSTVLFWTSPSVILEISDLFCRFYSSFDWKSC